MGGYIRYVHAHIPLRWSEIKWMFRDWGEGQPVLIFTPRVGGFRVHRGFRLLIFLLFNIIIPLAIWQCAAWSSTWITHNFPEKRRKPRKQNWIVMLSMSSLVYFIIRYLLSNSFASFVVVRCIYFQTGPASVTGSNCAVSWQLWRVERRRRITLQVFFLLSWR